ncbi:MAG: glucosaminidase domain-containing protein [Rikenellaceae bacterium]|nr:glucosaminidase domain-containing protein [Rikenellaceae bacterium]
MLFLRNSIITLSLLLLFNSPLLSQRTSRTEYILKYKDLAIKQMQTHGIPASITLAQACLESADGNATLAKEANNHFGIKCHNWTGDTFLHDDDTRNECFRKYLTVEQSYQDHSDFLRYRERYKFLFDLDPTDYKGWAEGLKKAGYATNPSYAQSLIKIIEDYNLSQYDHMTGSVPPSPKEIIADKEYKPIETSSLYKISLTRELFKKNGVAYIIGNHMDTYKNIAREYSLFTKELLGFNDLDRSQPIEDGTVIYVEKKRAKGDKFLEKHIAEQGETMYDISQKYGIRLNELYKMNGMKKGIMINNGQEIKLR